MPQILPHLSRGIIPSRKAVAIKMALTVKQLSADTSFLLTLEPIEVDTRGSTGQLPFRILLDPWTSNSSATVSSAHPNRLCVSNLKHLTEPDLVIITSAKSDHCHERTLRQLPRKSERTVILAEHGAARRIRSWKYFDPDMVRELPRWEDPRKSGKDTIARIEVPSQSAGGESGQVTVAHISQRKDIKSVHTAFGITYLPPTNNKWSMRRNNRTPSPTNPSPVSATAPQLPIPRMSMANLNMALPSSMPTPPASPGPKIVVKKRSTASLSPHSHNRGISIIFSPHGIPYQAIEPYATSHLLTEAVLPLTALIHCFNTVSNPWWLGGETSIGMPVAQETVNALGARALISAHDGEKEPATGLAGMLKRTQRRTYELDEVRDLMFEYSQSAGATMKIQDGKKGQNPTEIMSLAAGEEVTLTSEGIWEALPWSDDDEIMPLPPPVHAYPTPTSSFEWLPGPC